MNNLLGAAAASRPLLHQPARWGADEINSLIAGAGYFCLSYLDEMEPPIEKPESLPRMVRVLAWEIAHGRGPSQDDVAMVVLERGSRCGANAQLAWATVSRATEAALHYFDSDPTEQSIWRRELAAALEWFDLADREESQRSARSRSDSTESNGQKRSADV